MTILNDQDVYVHLGEMDILHDLEHGLEHSMILVHRLWIRPSELFPNGAQRVIIGRKYVKKVYKDTSRKDATWKTDESLTSKALKVIPRMFGKMKKSANLKPDEEWIGTPDGQIPLVRFGGMPSSVASLGRGQMDQIGPLQRIANRKFTAYVEVSNTTPDIHYLMPTNMQKDRIHNDVVFISHSSKIAGQGFEVTLRPDLSPWLNEIAWANNMMDQILGQPGASRGEVPGTRTAGTTLQKSKDFAAEMEGPENAAFNTAMAATQKRIILEGREVWPDEFMFKAIGESRKAELVTFKKTDLTSVVDVFVSREDPFPKDPFNRARGVALLQKETMLFGDPQTDPKTAGRVREAMKMPSAEEDDRHEHFQDQMVMAHMEALRKGPFVNVSWASDDEYHIQEEAELMAEFVASGEADEEFQKNVAVHIVFHQINQARKEKWLNINQETENIQEEIQAAVSMENLNDEERLALAEMEAAEAGV